MYTFLSKHLPSPVPGGHKKTHTGGEKNHSMTLESEESSLEAFGTKQKMWKKTEADTQMKI